ncbi:MAG: hypothetical protein KC589_04795, partial [Nanoarchaeota archaeon]|nr:hypothetical protein [Nanoarchaeota archaeon]
YYFYNKNEKKNIPTDDLLPEPVPSNRAYELAISDFLRNKARVIPAKLIEEKDNFIRLEPLDPNIIIEENRLPDKNKATGEYFQYSFIFVNYGLFAGPHLLVYSLSKGEEYLKGGIERFESGKHRNNWSKENRNYNMSSPVSENQRLELLKIDAIREGDKDILEEINALNKISIPKESAFVDDMDEDEYREKMRLNALNNMPKKKKKIKPNTQQIQPNLNEEGVEQ